MLLLKNIKIEEKTAEADFIAENELPLGHIIVDLASENILHITHVPGCEYMHPNHARQTLIEMAKNDDTRTERRVMWY